MDTTNIINPIIGGLLIGFSASAMMFFSGRIAGVSGIFSGVLSPKAGDLAWRVAFVAGLLVGGPFYFVLNPEGFASSLERSLIAVAIGGLLVGFGARLGSGCTSGHGVCGIARLGPRSIVATLAFVASGAVITFFVERFAGGAI